jgi:RNA recognition motif-containing protein
MKTSEKEILDFFKDFNPVDCTIIDKDNAHTNRFSFIQFRNEMDRDSAIQAKRGAIFKGISVVVNRSFNAYEGPRLGGRERVDCGDQWGFIDGPRLKKY